MRADAIEQLRGAAVRQIGAADRTGEERVAGKQNGICGEVKGYRIGRVAGNMRGGDLHAIDFEWRAGIDQRIDLVGLDLDWHAPCARGGLEGEVGRVG